MSEQEKPAQPETNEEQLNDAELENVSGGFDRGYLSPFVKPKPVVNTDGDPIGH